MERLLALALVALVATAAGLDGAVLPGQGGWLFAAAAGLAAAWALTRGLEGVGRLEAVGAALLLGVTAWQAAPVPNGLRALVAPGQAEWIDRVAPEWEGDRDALLALRAAQDVQVAVGEALEAGPDPLAGSRAARVRPGTTAPERLPFAFATLAAGGLLYALGRVVGRDERAGRWFAVGLLGLGVAEALYGVANRDGGSIGLGPKLHYLGSATGTFVNRGHFAAFLVLATGAAWGLAAALFPLQSDEIRRHRQRTRRSSHPPSVWEASGDRLPRLAVLALAAGLLGVGIVAAQSRTPMVAMLLTGTAVGLYAWRRRGEAWHLGIGLGVPVVVGLLAALGYGVRGAFGRFLALFGGGDVSWSSRVDLWREGFAAWVDAPVFGWGMGAWRLGWGVNETGVHLYDARHAHQELVEQLVEVGAVGTLGLGLLLAGWARRVARGFPAAEADDRTALGIGLLTAVLAVLLQGALDFPLHTPGVLLPTAIAAGIAAGSLAAPRPAARPAGWVGLAAVTALAALAAAVQDARWSGTRDQEVGPVPPVWYAVREAPDDLARALADQGAARRHAERTPLDPWGHAAVALTEARLAVLAREGAETGAEPEDHAHRVELAVARADALTPAHPRLEVELARALALLVRAGRFPDVRGALAEALLVRAVAADSWRAAEAFAVADALPERTVAALAATAAPDGVAAARIHHEHGRALERRRQPDAALAAHRRAVAADPGNGQAWFAVGSLLRVRGEAEAAADAFRAFLGARERPGGMEGWALIFLDDLDAAEARLRRVVADTPGNRWAWEGLAEVAARRGLRAEERRAWERVLAVDPGNARARARTAALDADERAGRPAAPGTTLPPVP